MTDARRKVYSAIYFCLVSLILFSSNEVLAQSIDLDGTGCQGVNLTLDCVTNDAFVNATMNILSITIFATTKLSRTDTCGSGTRECQRVVRTAEDTGLSDDYKHFFNYVYASCQGQRNCTVPLPLYYELIGDNRNDYDLGQSPVKCPESGVKYFVSTYIHARCIIGFTAPAVPFPPETTPRTTPTTPPTTSLLPIALPIFPGGLSETEKVVLGVIVGLAIVLLIVLLMALYCWERWRRNKKFAKLLRMLGAPQQRDDGYDDVTDYARADAWKEETNNLDALGEYTGVKPDEFLTIDRSTMSKSGLIIADPMSTMTHGNMCSTITRNNHGYDGPYVERGIGYSGPVNYETDENLELEQRMASVYRREDSVVSKENGEATTKY